MLSVFPTLLAFGMVGAAILRITLGLVIFFMGSHQLRLLKGHYSFQKFATAIATLEVIIGFFFTIGLFTQVAALALIIVTIIGMLFHKQSKLGFKQTVFYILIIGVSAALLFIGPGTLAFDLPL